MATRGAKVFLGYRWAFFLLFLVCNIVIISLSGWNYGLLLTGHASIAAYLAVTGIMAIIALVLAVALDFFWKKASTGCVAIECGWLAVIWVFEFVGAIILTVQDPVDTVICGPGAEHICASLKVLLAFTWLCSLLSIVHLAVLLTFALLHKRECPTIWYANIREFAWFGAPSAMMSTGPWKPMHLGAPSDAKPPPVYRATLARGEVSLEKGMNRRDLFMPAASTSQAFEQSYNAPRPAPAPQTRPVPQQAPSLYPDHLRSHLPAHMPHPYAAGSSSPPRGDRSRLQPQRQYTSERQDSVGSTSSASSSSSSRSNGYAADPAGRPRPTHPARKGSNGSPSRQRPVPPPLDLTRISAYRAIDERVSRK